jgi:hypothetical protein
VVRRRVRDVARRIRSTGTFRIAVAEALTLDMSDLTVTTLALEASHDRLGWGGVARLYGIKPDHTWVQVDEGDPYRIVEEFTELPGEGFIAVALACEGWAAPPGTGRPSRYPKRQRIRTVVTVTRDGGRVCVIRRRGEAASVTEGGAGMLMDRLLAVWPRAAADRN